MNQAANRVGTQPLTVAEQLEAVQAKFARLAVVRRLLDENRELYREQDTLMEDLMTLFIERTPTGWTVHNEITVGTQTYRYNPYFHDVRRNRVVAKVWKSAAFETGSIEG